VICFTPDHEASFTDLTSAQTELVLAAWIDRTAVLMARPDVAQVYCFENRGEEIGVTERHPHGQIYAYPFVTPRTNKALEAARSFAVETGANLFDDVLRTERDGPRVVEAGEYWTAFVPFAARWPFEVHLYPNRRVPNLLALDDKERREFIELYLDILRRFDLLFDARIAYISGWHQAPSGHEEFALHLELFTIRRERDKVKYLAGSESGMDAFISDISPEVAADRLRRTR
jgi:UDPglucose--hexose-1-phosphate uridylyltransferase